MAVDQYGIVPFAWILHQQRRRAAWQLVQRHGQSGYLLRGDPGHDMVHGDLHMTVGLPVFIEHGRLVRDFNIFRQAVDDVGFPKTVYIIENLILVHVELASGAISGVKHWLLSACLTLLSVGSRGRC